MIDKLLKLETILTKTEQKSINGNGYSSMCTALCAPIEQESVPIYDNNPFDNNPLPEEVEYFVPKEFFKKKSKTLFQLIIHFP